MGQVPPLYAIIGGGRLAAHLFRYFTLKKVPFECWSRKAGPPLAEFLGRLPAGSIALLAVPDDAIARIAAETPALENFSPVHFSGCAAVSGVRSAHPLSSFTFDTSSWTLADYEAVPFVLEAGGPRFEEIFPALENPAFYIPADKKPLYHALCVASGNFTAMLWAEAMRVMERDLSLPAEILVPYMKRVCKNIENDRSTSLTGPLQRRDEGTVAKNLAALEGLSLEPVYRAFAKMAGMPAGKKAVK